MDADTVSHVMHCKHLITDDDYGVITSAPNDMKMNCLILQYFKLMRWDNLMMLCDMLKEIETHEKIANILQNCKYCTSVGIASLADNYINLKLMCNVHI